MKSLPSKTTDRKPAESEARPTRASLRSAPEKETESKQTSEQAQEAAPAVTRRGRKPKSKTAAQSDPPAGRSTRQTNAGLASEKNTSEVTGV